MAMKSARLRSTRDIRRVFAAGCVAHGRGMVVHSRDRGDEGPSRWTAVAGRKVGGAVDRNRAKRRLRSIVLASPPPAGRDVVVIARRAALSRPFAQLTEEYGSLMSSLSCCGATEGGDAR